LLWYRQFDSSKPIDRGDAIFPVSYCEAIAARASAVAKGLAENERQLLVKSLGIKSVLAPVYRPKSLDSRKNARVTSSKLLTLRNALATGIVQSSAGRLLNISELVVSVVPFYRVLNIFLDPLIASKSAALSINSFSRQDELVSVFHNVHEADIPKNQIIDSLQLTLPVDDDDIIEYAD
jgi:hypothetical protein